MDIINVDIREDVFERLIKSKALEFSEIEIKQKEPKDFDYSISQKWKDAKKESTKAFRKQKEIEFQIRNNTQR